MGMVTYDGLNGASAQSCKTDRLTVWKVPYLSRQSFAGQIVAGTCILYIHMRSSSGLFHIHINAKSLVFGRNVNGNALKMLL